MAIYIALLRGINVGGHRKIKMTELKQTLEAIGLSRVQTYIQSGNVLFESTEEEGPLRKRIEQGIEDAFGFPVDVVLRTSAELRRTAASYPFSPEEIAEAEASSQTESLYVAFLPEEPSPEARERLERACEGGDRFHIDGREIYLLFRNSVRNSKLSGSLQRLGTSATVRNGKTVGKLVALADAMEA